jgi:hypothetical protein
VEHAERPGEISPRARKRKDSPTANSTVSSAQSTSTETAPHTGGPGGAHHGKEGEEGADGMIDAGTEPEEQLTRGGPLLVADLQI